MFRSLKRLHNKREKTLTTLSTKPVELESSSVTELETGTASVKKIHTWLSNHARTYYTIQLLYIVQSLISAMHKQTKKCVGEDGGLGELITKENEIFSQSSINTNKDNLEISTVCWTSFCKTELHVTWEKLYYNHELNFLNGICTQYNFSLFD